MDECNIVRCKCQVNGSLLRRVECLAGQALPSRCSGSKGRLARAKGDVQQALPRQLLCRLAQVCQVAPHALIGDLQVHQALLKACADGL